MRASQKKDADASSCEMVFGGQKLSQTLLPLATSVAVDLAVGKPGMFTLEMEGYGENQSLKWMDDAVFTPGTTVEVKMGDQSLTSLFFGEVVGINASFSGSAPPRMTVRAYDLSHRLTRGEKRRAFTRLKYSDIARTIASEAGLSPRTTDSGDLFEYVEQKGQSDLAFLLKLAEEINYQLMVVRKEMIFEPVSNDSTPIMKLNLDDDLMDFNPHISLGGQVSEVVVRGWDATRGAQIVGHARAGEEASKMGGQKSASKLIKDLFDPAGKSVTMISDHPVMSQSEADKLARASLNQTSLNLIEATGTMMGYVAVLPGKVIDVAGVSKWFSGSYYLINTTHRYDYESGYKTSFGARRNAL